MPCTLTLLFNTLEELQSKELKKFTLYLKQKNLEGCDPIPAGCLENLGVEGIADKLIRFYGDNKALEVTLWILREMRLYNLAVKLDKEIEETQDSSRNPPMKRRHSLTTGYARGEGIRSLSDESTSISSSRPTQSGSVVITPFPTSYTFKKPETINLSLDDTIIKKISERTKRRLKSTECLIEGTDDRKKNFCDVYTELYITDVEVKTQHELRQMDVQSQSLPSTQAAIECNDIFKPSTEPGESIRSIRTVMTKGIAGIGKSMTVQKFILDWKEGNANQDVDFIFILPFRQMNLFIDDQYSLHGLLCKFHPELQDITKAELFDKANIIFIFDGLDESKFRLKFNEKGPFISQITETASVDMLIVNLLKENLLPSASIWITSRPAAAHQIPPQYIDRWTEIQGFNDEQKEQYFRNKIKDRPIADRVMKQMKDSRCLYIMCRIPVFCWILATVLLRRGAKDNQEIPKTLTELFAHFIVIQLTRKEKKNENCEDKDLRHVLKSNKDVILKLAELAYSELEKDNVVFCEEDLKQCKLDIHEDLEKSGMCTEVFVSETVILKKKVFCFVHLSIQEFLAALYSFAMKGQQLHDLLESAVRKSMQSQNGHLDLFLRFLLGFSLESNQKLFKELLTHTHRKPQTASRGQSSASKTPSTSTTSPQRCMNLLLCLLELKDHSLHEEVEEYVKSGELLSPAVCSMLAYMMLVSEKTQEEFDLTKYNTTDKGRVRLVIAVRSCKKGRLVSCGLTKESCEIITSAIQSENSPLKELDLSCNDLLDAGVQVLSQGLSHANCNLETLRLASCNLTDGSCKTLVSVLQSSESHLRELDLTNNDLSDGGVQQLSSALSHPNCKLHTLILAGCNLTGRSCKVLAVALQSGISHLTHLDLTNNDLGEAGVDGLSAALGHLNCKLEILKLSGCLVSERACEVLLSVLTPKPSSLKELDLRYNHTGDSGVTLRSKLQEKGCQLNIDYNAEYWMKPGLRKYACELTLDIKTAHPELDLSEVRKVTRVEEDQDYPDRPQRFDCCPQVLCTEGLTGRHYWEAEWSGSEVVIGVAYRSIRRKAHGADCKIGLNDKSYGLWCEGSRYSVRYDKNKTEVPAPTSDCRRIAVYLDWPAGALSFYAVSSGQLAHLHTFHSRVGDPPRPGFSEPIYPGFWLHFNSYISLRQVI
ncbi:NACHT, LRR and PYD domains-containing protein 3-like [Alosa pseudoharengus]|uniref:NACHT, LRR and PYD domains-containing protein 3-like n=1 Tax=Alosa pseudoharengus TaxID=34774 RepID=UPI003F8B339D